MQAKSFTALFSTWSAYALVGAGIVGIWLMQNAFSAAPLHASLPAIAAGEPLAGIALGILVFGDSIQITPGLLAMEAGGIAAMIVGVVAVARSSAFSGLRKITEHILPEHILPGHPTPPGGPDGEPGRKPPGNVMPFRAHGGLADRPFPGASAPHGTRGPQVHGPASGGEGG
jgi:hypothetical protein